MKILVLALYAVIYHCNAVSAIDGPATGSNRPMDRFIDYIRTKDKEIAESPCKTALRTVVKNLRSFDPERLYHSFEMFDAWGKVPSGISYGHIIDMGNFKECININYKYNSTTTTDEVLISGKYCQAKFSMIHLLEAEDVAEFISEEDFEFLKENTGNQTVGFGIGICIPKICSTEEIELMIKNATNLTNVKLVNCSTKDPIPFELMDYVAICFFSLTALLLILSTSYDVITEQMQIKRKQKYLCFSVITNSRKLFALNVDGSRTISCIYGIRALSMFWVMIGHGLMFYSGTPVLNTKSALFHYLTPMSFVYYSGVISVDTFLFMSGFLHAWSSMREMKNSRGWLNIPSMYKHRLFRLLPLVAILMLFVFSFRKFLGSGPLWPSYEFFEGYGCEETWWKTLLFIQNYHNEKMCMSHTWYLAVDMQLFVLSPLILMPLYRWGKKFVPVIVLLASLSLACTYATFYKYGYSSPLISPEELMDRRFFRVYLVTHMRYTIWLIGILFGYIMFKIEDKKITIPRIYNLLAWAAVIITVFSIVFGPYNSRQQGYKGTVIEAVSYDYFSKVAWGLAMSWIIFSCQHGYGGLIGGFLAYPVWQVFSRLSFCMYLIHLSTLYVMFGNGQSSLHFSDFEGICTFWANLGITFTIAIGAVLCFEAPIIALEKIIFGGSKKPEEGNAKNDSQLNNESNVKSDSNVKNELSIQNETWEKTEKQSIA